jgi:hypothetical protein
MVGLACCKVQMDNKKVWRRIDFHEGMNIFNTSEWYT